MTTKNLTLSIDKDLLDKARVLAAIRRTSVNEMVRAFLAKEVQVEKEADEARSALLKLIDEADVDVGSWKPSRAETYSERKRFDR